MIIYGASGHGKVIHSIKREEVVFFFDDVKKENRFLNIEVAPYSNHLPNEEVIIAIGDNLIRRKISERVNHSFATVIAKSAQIDNSSVIGEGCQIIHGAIIQADCSIGEHTIINTGASVDHDCVVGDFCHIAPQVTLCGNISIGDGTIIGAGSTVIPGVKIGKWCTIGAGSVVTKPIPDYSVAVGNPARIIKSNVER